MSYPMKPETRYVLDWIGRMAHRWGGTVFDRTDATKKYDWGQALCREQYGPGWNDVVGEDPTPEDVERAKVWEEGDWPEWAWTLVRYREGLVTEEAS